MELSLIISIITLIVVIVVAFLVFSNKSKDTNSKNKEKEKIIETESEDIHTEIREIKSSSPIEVTQIDENTSSKKPKKKGWWS